MAFLLNAYYFALIGNWFFNYSWEVVAWSPLGEPSMLHHKQTISGEEMHPVITDYIMAVIMASNPSMILEAINASERDT